MSFLNDVKNFSKSKLNQTTTIVRTKDGVVVEESWQADGSMKVEHKGKVDVDETGAPLSNIEQVPTAAKIQVPPVECPDVPRFDIDSKDALDYLEENGYVIFKNALNADEIAHAKDLCWKWVASVKPNVQREDMSTWQTQDWPGSTDVGLINTDGAGQSEFTWYIRGIPKVKKGFELIWDTDDLIVSFDGFSMFRPWQYNKKWKTYGGWYHVDQNARDKPGKECFQGMVTLYDVDESTGGLTVVPGSHKNFTDIADEIGLKSGFDFVMMPKQVSALQTPGIITKAKAGDLIIWDSRTIHCNSPAFVEPKKAENPDLLRTVTYVCMTPRAKALDEVIEKRWKAIEIGMGSTHWPHYWRDHGTCSLEPPNLELNEYQKSLVGGSAAKL